jgi:hypothetical protein
MSDRLLTARIEPEASTPDELKEFQATETAKWKRIAADARMNLNEVSLAAISL